MLGPARTFVLVIGLLMLGTGLFLAYFWPVEARGDFDSPLLYELTLPLIVTGAITTLFGVLWRMWPLAVVVVALAAGVAYTAGQGEQMREAMTVGRDYYIQQIGGERVGVYGVELRLSPDTVTVVGPCGAWEAPLEVNLWTQQISFGAFEPANPSCGSAEQGPISRWVEVLRTVTGWRIDNDQYLLWLNSNAGPIFLLG